MSERGSAAVELVLILPAVVLLIMMIVEVAGAAQLHARVGAAAREGARAAATSVDPQAAIEAASQTLGDWAPQARITLERTWTVGGPAVVTIELPHRAFARLAGGVEILLRGSATMRVER